MRATGSRRLSQWLLVLLVVLYAVLVASYWVLRYFGRWGDTDTGILTRASATVMQEGTIRPSQYGYGHGFTYPSLTTFIATVAGLPLRRLQFVVYPLVAAGLSLAAFATYHVLTGDATAGALATLFLFVQPDFLFVILRGSHEKVTWLTAMLAVFLLAKSFGAAHSLSRFAAYVLVFYLAALALISSNTFFGSSFILAVLVSLTAGSAFLQISRRRGAGTMPGPTMTRLTYTVAATMVLWFLNAFYFYQPAGRILLELKRTVDQAAAVSLGYEPIFDPYSYVRSGWVSQATYFGLVLPSWIAGVAALVVWILIGKQLLRGRSLLQEPPRFLSWLLYAGFGVQFAIGIVVGVVGGMSGSVQLRLFPVIMLVGFPVLAPAIMRLWRQKGKRLQRRLLALSVSLLILWASGASLLRATNDPWLSNSWVFWTASEDAAMRWIETRLRYNTTWLDLQGNRVNSHALAEGFGDKTGNDYDIAVQDPETRTFLISWWEEALGVRLALPLPDVRDENRVYHNGLTEVYHRQPRTPYQH